MAFVYCEKCGKIIGKFYSILEVTDEFIDSVNEKHKNYCKPTLNSVEGQYTPLVNELSEELKP